MRTTRVRRCRCILVRSTVIAPLTVVCARCRNETRSRARHTCVPVTLSLRCLTPIVSAVTCERAERADKTPKHATSARAAPRPGALPHIRPIRPYPKQHPQHDYTRNPCELCVAVCHVRGCVAHPAGAHPRARGATRHKGRHTPHRHPPALRAPLSDCDTVSVRDISTISQILVADAAGA